MFDIIDFYFWSWILNVIIGSKYIEFVFLEIFIIYVYFILFREIVCLFKYYMKFLLKILILKEKFLFLENVFL